MTGTCHSLSPASPSSSTSRKLSPAYSSHHDDASDDDAFSDFDPLPCNPKLGFSYDGASACSKVPYVSVGGVDASTPLYSSGLREIFTEYEKALQGLANDKQHAIAGTGTDDTTSNPTPSQGRPNAMSSVRPNSLSAARSLPKRQKTSRRKAGGAKKNNSGVTTRSDFKAKKRALVRRCHEYEFVRLGDARQTEDGSIEVEVHWAPMYLTCDQLRGEKALEEARELVLRKFGQPAWERQDILL